MTSWRRRNKDVSAGIYAIRNTHTGAVYVGSSVDLEVRLDGHRSALKRGKHSNSRLQAAWNEDGPDGFVFEVLEILPDHNTMLDSAEERHFARFAAEGVMLYHNPRFAHRGLAQHPGKRWLRLPSLEHYRLLHGWTRDELGWRARVHPVVILDGERGGIVSRQNYGRLADILGTDIATLMRQPPSDQPCR